MLTRNAPVAGSYGAVARLHLINWGWTKCWPWTLVATSFAINYFIFANLDAQEGAEPVWTGGLMTIYVGVFIVGIFAMAQWLPFALGLSVTRARFYIVATLVTLGQCVAFALILTGLLAVEQATDGWGVGLAFVGPPGIAVDSLAVQPVVYTVSLLAAALWGMVFGLIYRRWGSAGVLVSSLAGGVLLLALVFVLMRPGAWSALVDWHRGRPQELLLLGCSVVLGAVPAAIGLALIRRTTP